MTKPEHAAAVADWYLDPMPGEVFARAQHVLRARGPVAQVSALGGALRTFMIVGHAALAEAFKDGERFPPGHAYQIISLPYIGRTFMSMDEADHRVYRPPITPAFRRGAVEALDEAQLEVIAHDLVDRFEALGAADLTRTFTRLFAFGVICAQLGLPRAREDDFYDWSMDIMFGGLDLEKSRRADAAFTEYVRPILEQRRRDPRDDVLTHLMHVEIEGEVLGTEAVLAHLRLFFTAGATTTSDALGSLLHAVLTHRAVWETCREDPSRITDTVEESLRWSPPVAAQPRFSNPGADVEFHGVTIPAGSPILFAISAANRDPEVFAEPDCFDIDRPRGPLLTFGPGLRTCPGMHLARKNLRVGLRVLTQRLPELGLESGCDSRPQGVLLRGPAALRARWR